MESDENFRMFRQFGYLHTRVLLYRQCELSNLEAQLSDLDDADADENNGVYLRSQRRDDARDGAPRKVLLDEIDEKLEKYGKLNAL
jgi:hypothetical protein